MRRPALSRLTALAAMTCVLALGGGARGQVLDSLQATADVAMSGVNAYDAFGRCVSFGDINGDNRDDMIVGAPGFDLPGRADCGVIYVLLASDTLSQAIDFGTARPDLKRIYGPFENSVLGSVIACGDVNNDGRADVVCGMPGVSPFSFGEVYVVFGSDQLADSIDLLAPPASVTRILGKEIGKLGHSLAVGDVDDDSFGDIVAGAPFAESPAGFAAGKVFVIYGSQNPEAVIDLATTSSRFTEIFGEGLSHAFGTACGVGDVNNDTIDDIVAGAPQAGPPGRDAAGVAYIVPGAAAMPDTIATANAPANGITRMFGPAAGALLGSAFAIGHMTGDAFDDLAVSAPDHSPLGRSNAGSVFVLEGGTAWPDTLDLASGGAYASRIDGPTANVTIGLALDAADLNMDGYDDVVIGAPNATPSVGRSEAGEAFVVFGRQAFEGPVDLSGFETGVTKILGESPGDNLGGSLATGRSTNSGFDDLLVGASGVDIDGRRSVGMAFVILGDPDITPTQVVSHDSAALPDGVLLTWVLADDIDPFAMSVSRESFFSGEVRILGSAGIRRTGRARYELFDPSTQPGETYIYTVLLQDGGQILFREEVSTPRAGPARLMPGYPNPFRQQTTIPFLLEQAGHVTLRVYDVTGALVRVIADSRYERGPGEATWDGRNRFGRHAPTGIYFVQMQFRGETYRRKIVIIR